MRNNQQGVLYFAANVKPGVLTQQPATASSLDDLFVSVPPAHCLLIVGRVLLSTSGALPCLIGKQVASCCGEGHLSEGGSLLVSGWEGSTAVSAAVLATPVPNFHHVWPACRVCEEAVHNLCGGRLLDVAWVLDAHACADCVGYL